MKFFKTHFFWIQIHNIFFINSDHEKGEKPRWHHLKLQNVCVRRRKSIGFSAFWLFIGSTNGGTGTKEDRINRKERHIVIFEMIRINNFFLEQSSFLRKPVCLFVFLSGYQHLFFINIIAQCH